MAFVLPLISAIATAGGAGVASAASVSFTTIASWAMFGASIAYSIFNRPKPVVADKPEDVGGFRSAVGKFITIPYGVIPVECHCIDLDFRPEVGIPYEIKDRTSTGGYFYGWVYRATWASLVCEKPVSKVLKIWLDDKLVYDVTTEDMIGPSLDLEKPKPITTGGDGVGDDWISDQVIIYTGDQTEADPTFKQLRGNDYPIYKGSTYIVFKNWVLTHTYGNHIPNVKVLVATDEISETVNVTAATEIKQNAFIGATPYNLTYGEISGVGPAATYIRQLFYANSTSKDSWTLKDTTINLSASLSLSNANVAYYSVFRREVGTEDLYYGMYLNPYSRFLNIAPLSHASVSGYVYIDYRKYSPVSDYKFHKGAACYHDGVLYQFDGISNNVHVYPVSETVFTTFTNTRIDPTLRTVSGYEVGKVRPEFISYGGSMYLFGGFGPNASASEAENRKCYSFDGTALTLLSSDITSGLSVGPAVVLCGCIYKDKLTALYRDSDDSKCYLIQSEDGVTWTKYVSNAIIDDAEENYTYSKRPCMGVFNSVLYIIGGTKFTVYSLIDGIDTTTGIASLDIFQDIADRVGYTGTLDFSGISMDKVLGYAIDRWTTGKEAIEPLQKAFFFDVVFHDGIMEFVKRGTKTPVVLSEDDLGWGSEGQSEDKLKFSYKSRKNLPRETLVQYFDPELNYQQNNQKAERNDLQSPSSNILQLPMALNADTAKSIASVLVQDMIQNTRQVNFTLSDGYSYLLPGDLITTTVNDVDYTIRLAQISIEEGICRCSGVVEDTAIYERTETAPVNLRDDYTEKLNRSACNVLFLDIPRVTPVLSEQDGKDGYGFYAAVAPIDTTKKWQGSDIYRWNADPTAPEWFRVAESGNACVMGQTMSVLGDVPNPWILDNANTVRVSSNYALDETAVSSDDLSKFNTLCLIGDELVQYKKATKYADNVYDLSGLMRGLFGTEKYCGTHEGAERFVLLRNRVYVPLAKEELGKTFIYRVKPVGRDFIPPFDIHFNSTGVSKRCLSPVHVTAVKRTDGAFYIEWMGRSRGIVGWFSSQGGTIMEAVERYEVVFLDGSDEEVFIQDIRVVNLDHSRKPRFLFPVDGYTVENETFYGQTDIFGSEQINVKFRIYQINELGRGFGIEHDTSTGITTYI